MASDYLKPELPHFFELVNEAGIGDGPWYSTQLEQSDWSRKPWGLTSFGAPRVLRLTKQEGNKLYTDDGVFVIKEIKVD